MPPQSLTNKVVTSLGWIFANMLTKNVLLFVRTVVLWRLLSEEDFGLNGMAWLAINGFTLLQDMGFQSALIHWKKDIDKAVSVTWYANVAIRIAVYAILFAIAPFVAEHFNEPLVSPILRVASLCIVLGSFGTANEALLRKKFQFGRILVVDSLELVVQVASQIALAATGFGVWSLVYGTMIAVVVRSLTLWRIAPIRLVAFDMAVAREMFQFGKHMTLSSLLLWLIGNMDYYFIGKFLGKGALGFYTLAFRLAYLLSQNVARMLGAVLFPAFSEIGSDAGRVRGAWLRSIRYAMVLMVPMGFGLALFAPELIGAFYKPKCQVVVATMAILTFSALFRGVGVPLGDLQKGIGKPYLLTRIAFVHVLLMGPLLFAVTAGTGPLFGSILSRLDMSAEALEVAKVLTAPLEMGFGLAAAAAVITGTTFVAGLWLGLSLTSSEVGFTAQQVRVALRPSLVAGGAMVVAGIAAKLLFAVLLPSMPAILRLALLGPIVGAVYPTVLWFLFPSVAAELKSLLREFRSRRGAKGTGAALAAPPAAPPAAL